MEWAVFTDSEPIARKDYSCDAYGNFLSNYITPSDIKGDDEIVWQNAKADNFMIKKGMKYLKRTGLFDGVWQTFRARKDMDALCIKFDLYSE